MARHLATTNWTLIVRAEATDPDVRREAMAELCEAYWYPLYAFARRRGSAHDDAADLTQAFFVHLIDKHALRGLEPVLVRFRAYLLASFKNFQSDVRDRMAALKRGGDRHRVTFDPAALERRYSGIACPDEDPERLYERQWAETLLKRARERLRLAYVAAGKTREFEALGPHLVSSPAATAARELAQRLEITEGAARVALYRLRRRFGAELRAEVGATVGEKVQVESELRFLLDVLAGPPRAESGPPV
jgi:RNA polymerase sigma-70 factor (ECF subfamily)